MAAEEIDKRRGKVREKIAVETTEDKNDCTVAATGFGVCTLSDKIENDFGSMTTGGQGSLQ